MNPTITRRQALRTGATAAGALALGPRFWHDALAAPARPGPGPYGPLQPADANGLMLPGGFTSSVVARGGATVGGTGYTWHSFSDGMGTFAAEDGGWILASNSEFPGTGNRGGASAVRFAADGRVLDAYRILDGTTMNCAGGVTPWGTWLSCEESASGQVWECDPTGTRPAVARPALGRFTHEAVCADPDGRALYLTEDTTDAGWYRFTPSAWPSLEAGVLEIAFVDDDGHVTWRPVPDPSGASAPTRSQVPGSARFQRGEGTWFDAGVVYFVTTFDSRVYAYEIATQTLEILYDGIALGPQTGITDIDNVTVAARSGDIFVCEDISEEDSGGGVDLGILSREREAAKFLTATGPLHSGSELCGVCFDPSGTRMYVASQRSGGFGAVFEVTGPFRGDRSPARPPEVAAGPPARDASRPALRVSVLGTATLRRFRRAHLPVRVTVDEGVTVTATLTRGRVTLARTTARKRLAGRLLLRLRPRPAGLRALRRRTRVRALLTVVAVDAAGNRTTVRRRVHLKAR